MALLAFRDSKAPNWAALPITTGGIARPYDYHAKKAVSKVGRRTDLSINKLRYRRGDISNGKNPRTANGGIQSKEGGLICNKKFIGFVKSNKATTAVPILHPYSSIPRVFEVGF
jgi:hypothetical protein